MVLARLMVSMAHDTKFDAMKKILLEATKQCQIMPHQKRKKPAVTRA